MATIKLNIDVCSNCPFFSEERVYREERAYREDIWDTCYKWYCDKSNKIIRNYVDCDEKIPIPDWCEFNKDVTSLDK